MEDYKSLIKSKMSTARFIHSVNVSKEAARLAKRYGADVKKAEIAGMLHDITKELPFDEQLKMMESNGIILSNVQLDGKKLWHAITGSLYIHTVLNITDQDIVNAVRYHTTGRQGMSLLEQIIYVADFTSAERTYADVEIMRKKADENLESAMLFGVTFTLSNLVKRKLTVHPNTVALYNELILDLKSK